MSCGDLSPYDLDLGSGRVHTDTHAHTHTHSRSSENSRGRGKRAVREDPVCLLSSSAGFDYREGSCGDGSPVFTGSTDSRRKPSFSRRFSCVHASLFAHLSAGCGTLLECTSAPCISSSLLFVGMHISNVEFRLHFHVFFWGGYMSIITNNRFRYAVVLGRLTSVVLVAATEN